MPLDYHTLSNSSNSYCLIINDGRNSTGNFLSILPYLEGPFANLLRSCNNYASPLRNMDLYDLVVYAIISIGWKTTQGCIGSSL